MSGIAAALAPVGLVIALGWALRRFRFPGDAFWAPAERVTYYVLFPALLVHNLGSAPLGAIAVGPVAAAMVSALLAAAALMMAVRRRLGVDRAGFSSLFQGAVRLNTFAGLAATVALWGEPGLTIAAVAVASFIPTANVLSVAVLSRYGGSAPASWRHTLVSIARNPLILGCAAGAALNAAGIGVPPGLDGVLDILGRASLPLGLLCVGAGLTFAGLRHAGRGIAATCAVKLAVVPAVAAAVCAALGVEGLAARVVVLFAALPTASNAYILARQMGGDATLMAQVIAATTLGAAVTIPAILAILG